IEPTDVKTEQRSQRGERIRSPNDSPIRRRRAPRAPAGRHGRRRVECTACRTWQVLSVLFVGFVELRSKIRELMKLKTASSVPVLLCYLGFATACATAPAKPTGSAPPALTVGGAEGGITPEEPIRRSG